ncbi:MAG: RNA polymerase sigma-70 factor [Bacteroidota bacterium]
MFFKRLNYQSDDELLTLIRERDDSNAFKSLYTRYWGVLLDASYKRLKSIETAEEIVQEVFIDLYLRREEIKPKTSVEAYLKTAVKYKVFNYYRSQQIHLSYLNTILESEQIIQPSIEQSLASHDLHESIEKTLALMPEKCREVFVLSKFEQLSNQEIATRLGIAISTVKKHITKAYHILKINLGNRRHEF